MSTGLHYQAGLTAPALEEFFDRYLRAWNDHDGPSAAACMAADAVYEDVAAGRVMHGRDEIGDWVAEGASFSSDLRFDKVSFFFLDSAFATEWVMTGTNDGEIAGRPATGKPFRVRGASIGKVDSDGLIVENRDYWNMAEVLVQLGLATP